MQKQNNKKNDIKIAKTRINTRFLAPTGGGGVLDNKYLTNNLQPVKNANSTLVGEKSESPSGINLSFKSIDKNSNLQNKLALLVFSCFNRGELCRI